MDARMMPDLQKTIQGLRCHSEPKFGPDEYFCETCPYDEATCGLDVPNDALSLLKAQEPRVMDADEIVQSADPSKWLWVERKGDYCAEAFKAGKTISGLIAFDSETPGAFLHCERPDDYGKTWRCWTSRPTDKQREETPWHT